MGTPAAAAPPPGSARARTSLLGLLPLALVAGAVALFALLGAPGLGDRRGPPVEELTFERTVLRPGQIELTVRNDGPDAVRIAEVTVNDAYVNFRPDGKTVGRLGAETLTVAYPWIEGEAYEISLHTSSGATIDHEIPVAVETPSAGVSFYGLMALLGTYVGILPIALGMLWLPFIRRVRAGVVSFLMAVTLGLLVFLAVDATLEGLDVAADGAQVLGGTQLVFLGAIVAYLVLAAIDAYLRARRRGTEAAGAYLALLVAIGIGLHNLGEGLAIGAAYAVGALALGALLVIAFALHNTTEGLAIVAPVAAKRPSLARLVVLGAIAGTPAILGAWIGAAAYHPSVSAFLLGVGAGAIVQVIQQLAPLIRDRDGRYLHPRSAGGLVLGIGILYVTGLLANV
jgi:ZIP family zinc transporter